MEDDTGHPGAARRGTAPPSAPVPFLDRLPLVRALPPARRARTTEILRFLMVGGMNWVVDFAVFNIVRAATQGHWVMLAKVAAVAVATLFSWVVNRSWTFRSRATDTPHRELAGFVVVNVLGMVPPLACLWFSHHVMWWTSVLADNISANVVGLVIGTILRYLGYRFLVFTGSASAEPVAAVIADAPVPGTPPPSSTSRLMTGKSE